MLVLKTIRSYRIVHRSLAIILFAGVIYCPIDVVSAAEYHVDRTRERLVRFISDAPFEDFDGVTDLIDGYVVWNGDSLVLGDSGLPASEFYFEVQLDGLDTGLGLRNRHMRENYLETDKYPYVRFTGSMQQVQHPDDSTYMVTAEGIFQLHGVERKQSIVIYLRPDTNGYMLSTEFQVSLTDHDIEVPKLMFLKINEIVELEVSFHLMRIAD